MRRRGFRVSFSVGLCLILLLAACSASGEDGDSGSISPLELAIDEISGSELARPSEAGVADCLKDRGVSDAEIKTWTDRRAAAFADAQRGFGVASSVGHSIAQILGLDIAALASIGFVTEPTERDILEAALSGTPDQPGCQLTANQEFGGPMENFSREFALDLTRMEQRYTFDPRVLTFWDIWSTCMSGEGYDTVRLAGLTAGFIKDLNSIIGQIEVRPRSLAPVDLLRSKEHKERILNGEVSIDIERQLGDLQAREESAAAATVRCGASPRESSIPPELLEVRLEYENAFLAKNGPRVEQLRSEARALFGNEAR